MDNEKPEFHVDDEFDIELVAVDLETEMSIPITDLTGPELRRRIVVPKALEAALLAHIRKAKKLIP